MRSRWKDSFTGLADKEPIMKAKSCIRLVVLVMVSISLKLLFFWVSARAQKVGL